MRPTRLVVLGVLIAVAACVSFAQTPIDPGIGLGGTGSCATLGSFDQTSLTQTFTVNSSGCIVDISNDIPGATLISITITVPADSVTGPLSCFTFFGDEGTKPFAGTPVLSGDSCTFSGPPGFDDAVLPGGAYGLELTSFSTQTLSITVAATATPEPGTMLLLGTGLAALVAVRKRRKLATSNV